MLHRRFGQLSHTQWSYFKTEGNVELNRFTHLLTANATVPGFSLIATEPGFERFDIAAVFRGESPFKTKPMVYIHQNNDREPQVDRHHKNPIHEPEL